VLDPQLFVFGGGVAAAGERLLEPIRAAYLETLPARGYHPEPTFAVAELGNDAGVVGAADLARAHLAARGRTDVFSATPDAADPGLRA
jgi:glucokinase